MLNDGFIGFNNGIVWTVFELWLSWLMTGFGIAWNEFDWLASDSFFSLIESSSNNFGVEE